MAENSLAHWLQSNGERGTLQHGVQVKKHKFTFHACITSSIVCFVQTIIRYGVSSFDVKEMGKSILTCGRLSSPD